MKTKIIRDTNLKNYLDTINRKQNFSLQDVIKRDVIGDRSCFFRALSYHLNHKEEYHFQNRQYIGDYAQNNLDLVNIYLSAHPELLNHLTPEKYIEEMRKKKFLCR